ncbi:M55 family metallopeptidase [Amycolatopsis jejuensis]|uniref:M55 family metallopeptidase n=1 Tax=Amycolatopsis jejuensis TaxID=330084 RepID=UPI0005272C75|nr:M55 family metallopeptidase [Amycolatopsis jejuensis]
MLVYLSVDLEGVAGIATLDQILRGGSGYPRAQSLMTAEANAAIRGAFAGGATEVVVSDSHGTMDNLLADQLDPRARIVTGGPRPACMAQGLSRDAAVAIFVGYHAAAGAPGVLSHTFSANFTQVRVNGEPVSEAEVNALYAADRGVPIGALTGDDRICAVAREAFPGVRTVETKQALGWSATDSLHPAAACAAIEAATGAATAEASRLSARPVPETLDLEVGFASALGADFAATAPGTDRLDAHTLRYRAPNVDELLRAIMAWYYLAALAAQQSAAVALRR